MPRMNAAQEEESSDSDVISREEYERLYAAAKAASPMFSGKSSEGK